MSNSLFPNGDYVSQGLQTIKLDEAFPNMVVGQKELLEWEYLRREIPHNWYVDRRNPNIGFLNRDEALILYNNALQFKGKRALEIGCWMGWSACHLIAAGVRLDIVDPVLRNEQFAQSVAQSLRATAQLAGVSANVQLHGGPSPAAVQALAAESKLPWSLIFIDGDHTAPCPLNDTVGCVAHADRDAMILFHDLVSPDVAQGLAYLKQQGWNTMVYQTMQIMGVAWRGSVTPVGHQPDPNVSWTLPDHLQQFNVSQHSDQEFREVFAVVRPYTMLSEARLSSLYTLAKRVCLSDLPGNFVECGTCKGGASALIAYVIKNYSRRLRRLYSFDTFEGMPPPTEHDRHQGIPANDTGYGEGTLMAPIAANLKRVSEALGVSEIIQPVQGLFADTLPQYRSEIGQIAMLHADADWYESTVDIFQTLYDSVVPGGFVQIDDYGFWEGCRTAIHDFQKTRNIKFGLNRIDETGVWFQKA